MTEDPGPKTGLPPALPRQPKPKPSPAVYRRRRLVALAVAIVLVFGLGYAVVELVSTQTDYPGPGTGSVRVQITPGMSVRAMGRELEKAGVVRTEGAFVRAAKLQPRATSIQPGFYELRLKMKARDAIAALLDPKSRVLSRVTVREGWRVSEVVPFIAKRGDLPRAELDAAIKDAPALGLPAYAKGNVEGFLFPATYDIEPDDTGREVIARMLARFRQGAAKVRLEERAAAVNISPYQAVIVASIVEAEARRPEDFGKVARVIYNRLNAGTRLQMDSTVHFATGSNGSVFTTSGERASTSPYNTYRYTGLPPGPINSPGERALEAALAPTPGDWIFFVSVNLDTGENRFARTREEHAANQALLQKWCREHKGKC